MTEANPSFKSRRKTRRCSNARRVLCFGEEVQSASEEKIFPCENGK
jgi:hypothetical protein